MYVRSVVPHDECGSTGKEEWGKVIVEVQGGKEKEVQGINCGSAGIVEVQGRIN